MQSLEELQATLEQSIERDERALRMQDPDNKLAPDAERALELFRAEKDPLTRTLRTWAYLKHLSWAHAEGLQRPEGGEDRAAEAMRALLRREPVEANLGARTVTVTARSYAALAEIAAHQNRLTELEVDLRHVRHRLADAYADLTMAQTRRGRGILRRRARRLARLFRDLTTEASLHRQAIYAHVFTPSGAPATSVDDAPPWWDEIDPAGDVALFRAVWEVGAGRYEALGPAPIREERGREPAESFGWASHFAAIERHQKMPPASLFNADLYQQLAWARAGADAPPDAEDLE